MPIIVNDSSAVALASLAYEVAPHVSECPRPLIERALWRATRDFMSDSRCWRARQLTLLTTVANQESYTYAPPAGAELLQVMSCFRGTEEVECELPGEQDDFYPGEADSDYRIGVADDGLAFELHPAPQTAGEVLTGSVAYTLATNATTAPAWIVREHSRALVHGAAALLVIEPGKPWTNAAAYDGHRAMFQDGVRQASNAAGPVRRKPLRVTPW